MTLSLKKIIYLYSDDIIPTKDAEWCKKHFHVIISPKDAEGCQHSYFFPSMQNMQKGSQHSHLIISAKYEKGCLHSYEIFPQKKSRRMLIF